MEANRIPRIRAEAVCLLKPRFGTGATVACAVFYFSKQVTSSDSSSKRLDFTLDGRSSKMTQERGIGVGGVENRGQSCKLLHRFQLYLLRNYHKYGGWKYSMHKVSYEVKLGEIAFSSLEENYYIGYEKFTLGVICRQY